MFTLVRSGALPPIRTSPLRILQPSACPLSSSAVLQFKSKYRKKYSIPDEPHNPPEFPEKWKFPKPEVPKEKESYRPSKLLMVHRVHPMKGRPIYEKLLMAKLGLDGPTDNYVIMKNSPGVNAKLWSLKHLIRVRPITFPNGLPADGDVTGTYLKDNGEFVVSQKLKMNPALIASDEDHERSKFDYKEINEYLRLKWQHRWDW